jgi:hypothetical protein
MPAAGGVSLTAGEAGAAGDPDAAGPLPACGTALPHAVTPAARTAAASRIEVLPAIKFTNCFDGASRLQRDADGLWPWQRFTVDAQADIRVYTPPAETWRPVPVRSDVSGGEHMEGNGQTGASVEELVAARLDQSEPGGRAADLVLASLLGDDDLHAVLTGTTGDGGRQPQARPATETQLAGRRPWGPRCCAERSWRAGRRPARLTARLACSTRNRWLWHSATAKSASSADRSSSFRCAAASRTRLWRSVARDVMLLVAITKAHLETRTTAGMTLIGTMFAATRRRRVARRWPKGAFR